MLSSLCLIKDISSRNTSWTMKLRCLLVREAPAYGLKNPLQNIECVFHDSRYHSNFILTNIFYDNNIYKKYLINFFSYSVIGGMLR